MNRIQWPEPLGHTYASFKMRHIWTNNNWRSWLSNILAWSWIQKTRKWSSYENNKLQSSKMLMFIICGQSEIYLNMLPPSSTRLYWKSPPPFKSHICHGFLKFIDVQFVSFKHFFTHFRRVVFSIRCRT